MVAVAALRTQPSAHRIKYYNNCLIHNVQRNFIFQTGDPTGTGTGGNSIYGYVGCRSTYKRGQKRPE